MNRVLIFALLLCPALLQAQGTNPTCNGAPVCMPGDIVTVSFTDRASIKTGMSFEGTLTPSKGTSENLAIPGLSGATACKPQGPDEAVTRYCFQIPLEAVDGTYGIQVKGKAADGTTASALATSPSQLIVERPAISSVSPAAAFATERHDNKIVLFGKGFARGQDSPSAGDTADTRFQFLELPTPDLCLSGCDAKKEYYQIKVDSDRQITLLFHRLDASLGYFNGQKKFAIFVGNAESNISTLGLIDTTAETPMTIAVIFFVLILVVVYLLLRGGEHATKQHMNGKDYWMSALFFDIQTRSYSLSKCQFYAWTAAAVLGYVYLAVSKSIVQGSGVFPDIPSGLPGILIASVGTVVASNGITSAKGDKGAGNPGPNISDFIASGGVVAPDRLQFAVWTLVGIGTFLHIVLHSDPRSINDLPAIPSGFLQLMGISSAGYLAGKLVRKPGPTISAMLVTSPDPNSMRFSLTGSGLSRSAMFSIDGVQIFPDKVLGLKGTKGPDVVQQDPTITDPDFARVLAFQIQDPPDSWRGAHDFTITNPDAQKATVKYQKFWVQDIKVASAGTGDAVLTISGECLDQNLKIHYAGAKTVDFSPAKDKVTSTKYEAPVAGVSEARGGQVTVTVSDDAGGSVSKAVTVG